MFTDKVYHPISITEMLYLSSKQLIDLAVLIFLDTVDGYISAIGMGHAAWGVIEMGRVGLTRQCSPRRFGLLWGHSWVLVDKF